MSAPNGGKAVEILTADPGLARLQPPQREALRNWSSNYSYLVQNVLYETEEASGYEAVERGFVEGLIAELDEVFRLVEGPSEPVSVYRAGSQPEIGTSIPGYLACTTDLEVAQSIAGAHGELCELLIPAYSGVVYLPAATEPVTAEENEVLVNRDSRLILKSVQAIGDRRLTVLELEQ